MQSTNRKVADTLNMLSLNAYREEIKIERP